jgi:hypothetical protein
MDDPITAAIDRWRKGGVQLNPPAHDQNLAVLARFLGGRVPSELARFYRLANGMVDYETDEHMVSFWSIERVFAAAARFVGIGLDGVPGTVHVVNIAMESFPIVILALRPDEAGCRSVR